MNKNLKIKVCGMRYPDNIADVSKLPIDHIGFIFYPKSARYVPHTFVPKTSVSKIGVFVNEGLNTILQKASDYDLQGIQLHGDESPELCQILKDKGYYILKAFGIDDEFDWRIIAGYLDATDALLFDTKSTKHGGTGQTFNWEKLHENPYEKPYFLSGGLSIDNIEQAMTFEDKRLIGLDLNSKFELEPGLKNIDLLTQVLKLIKQ